MNFQSKEIHQIYKKIKSKIKKRLAEFRNIWKHGTEEDIFTELVFCLLTPQSKAKSCWAAVERLKTVGARRAVPLQIEKCLNGVRFHHNKARYIIKAREKFFTIAVGRTFCRSLKKQYGIPIETSGRCAVRSKINHKEVPVAREWLVENIKGLGYKEASHFLRNIGFGKNIAILDRHILKNLKKFGVIKEMPKTITAKNYCIIEEKMRRFAEKINIALPHLDFVFWYAEAGDVFK